LNKKILFVLALLLPQFLLSENIQHGFNNRSSKIFDQHLVFIQSEFKNRTYDLYLRVDEYNNPVSFKIIRLYRTKNREKYFNFDLLNKGGIILNKHKGYEILTLKGKDISMEHGGNMDLDYLYNAFTGSRKKVRLLAKNVGGKFILFKDSPHSIPEQIEKLLIKVRTICGIPIGIDRIILNPA